MPHPKFGKIALSLAGGGARGIVQAGMIEAWRDFCIQNNMEHDVLFGTSVGTLNGIFVHQEEWSQLRPLWMNIHNKDVYKWNPLVNIFSPVNSNACIFDTTPLFKKIKSMLKPELIKANKKDFYVNATDLKTWAPMGHNLRNLDDSEMATYIRASASPPVLFPVIPFRGLNIGSNADDTALVDGGLVNNFSVFSAVKQEADTIIVLSPTTPDPKVPKNILDMIGLLASIPEYEFLEREIKFVNKLNEIQSMVPSLKEIKVVKVQPPKPVEVGLLDFEFGGKDRKQLIDYGYALAMSTFQKELV